MRADDQQGISPVNYYRCWLPLDAIKRFGGNRFDVRIYTQVQVGNMMKTLWTGATDKLLLGRHIYVMSRLHRKKGLDKFLDAIHESGGVAVFDTDDDLTDEFRDLGAGEDFVYTIKKMDLVTVSTPHLANRMSEYIGYRPTVLENHIDFKWFSKVSATCTRRVPGISVGLIGTASHYDDWKYPVEALVRLGKKYRNVTVAVAGYMPDYLKRIGAYELKGVPYWLYPTLMRQFDVVCCSLDPADEFNKSKSAIKHLEASAAERTLSNGKIGGAVAVCTDMPVYRRTVSNGNNGILVSNDGWYDALELLVVDEKLRNRVAVNGYRWTKKHRDADGGHKKWARLYRALATKGVEHVRSSC